MNEGSLAKLIAEYESKLDLSIKKKSNSETDHLIQEFYTQVRLLEGIEDEIVAYLEESISSRKWGEYSLLWFGTAIDHPSSKYIPYLIKILEEPDPSYPHYKALDTLAYMPESISEEAVPELIRIMESHNPAWAEYVLEKFFETLVFIGADEGFSYIIKAFHSPNKAIALFAEKWMDSFVEFENVCLEDLVPNNHPLRRIEEAIDFSSIEKKFPTLERKDEEYLHPVMLLKTLFLGYFYEMSSERLILDRVGLNMPCRWFVGLSMTDPAPPLHVLTQNRRRVEGITVFQEIFDGLVLEAVNKGFIDKGNILRGEYYDPDGGDVTPQAIRASTQRYFRMLEVETKTDQ